MFIASDIINFGYLQLSKSTIIDMAILSQKIIYLGASFISLILLLCIIDICKVHVKKIIKLALYIISTLSFFTTLTIGLSDMFYKSVMLKTVRGATVMIKEYGIMHTIAVSNIFFCMFFGIATLIYALKKKKDISIKNVILLLFCNLFAILSLIIGRKLGTLDALPFSLNLTLALFCVLSNRFIFYDVDSTEINSMMKGKFAGIISFDLKYRFLGSNKIAKYYFPELNRLRVDFESDEDEFNSWIKELEKNHSFQKDISKDGKFYTVTGQHLMIGKKTKGFQFIVQDCTDAVVYQEHLRKLATTDELTGLFNRRAFENEIEKISKCGEEINLVIISLDLNGLKKANDTIGHHAGDELICSAGECIFKSFSPYGKTYRTGGDEFEAILYTSIDKLDSIILDFNEKCASWKGKYSDALSISKGYALKSENPTLNIHELIKIADEKMYEDKKNYYEILGIDRRR